MHRLAPWLSAALLFPASIASATTLDWDAVTWPAGDLARTFTSLGGGDVTITISGETGGLVAFSGAPSPNRSRDITGGLSPAEYALAFQTDYVNGQTPEITITIDFSHPGGVDGVSFSIFELDLLGSNHVDEITATATDGTSTFDPASVVTSSCNTFDGIDTVTGTCSSGDSSAGGNATLAFTQTGITRVTIAYRNLVQPNPGLQHIALHDISFDVGADLSLALAVSDVAPAVGDVVTLSLTAANGGPGAASGVAVSAPLPTGFTYTGDDGGGTYVPGTGAWNVGGIATGASASLEISARVDASGDHDVVAEVSAADQPDPDSTPGNGNVAEDDRAVVSVTPDPLEIAKRAFAVDGTPITNASMLASGSRVRFLLYVNNRGGAVPDVSLEDVLDPDLVYVPGSIRIDTSTPSCASPGCTPVEEATIFTAADAAAAATDAVDGDAASVASTTLSIGDEDVPGNAQLDLPAGRVLAVRFEVRID